MTQGKQAGLTIARASLLRGWKNERGAAFDPGVGFVRQSRVSALGKRSRERFGGLDVYGSMTWCDRELSHNQIHSLNIHLTFSDKFSAI